MKKKFILWCFLIFAIGLIIVPILILMTIKVKPYETNTQYYRNWRL